VNKKSTKYIPIDKSVIQEGMACDFTLFSASNSNAEMHSFKESGVSVTSEDILFIATQKHLYVAESEHEKYEQYRKNIIEAQKQKIIKHISFEEQALAIYSNAAEILNRLFSDPETLGHYIIPQENNTRKINF